MKSIKHCVRNNWVLLTVLILAIATAAFLYSQVSGEFQSTLNLGEKNSKLPFYGQLGDFFGGILNPAFGLITVCLLVWSIKIQVHELQASREELKLSRKEIVLSRVEMERSANALADQVRLNQNEYNRKQVETAAEHYIRAIEKCFEIQIEVVDVQHTEGRNFNAPVSPTVSLNEALHEHRYRTYETGKPKLELYRTLFSDLDALRAVPLLMLNTEITSNLAKLVACVENLGQQYLNNNVLGAFWEKRVHEIIDNAYQLDLISHDIKTLNCTRITKALIKEEDLTFP